MPSRSLSRRGKFIAGVLIVICFVAEMLLVAFSPRGSAIRSAIVVVDVFVVIAVIVLVILLVRRDRRSH